ncbi:MAG: hypothetical protein AT710_02495 [Thermocladium sp. ECH_B]|nr:MAG: hypothetical protein AT710_02495 [Thermocladium sp. ECH_B]
MPPNQLNNPNYYQYGVFWLYNWFQAENNTNNMNIFFLMNGNIFNYSLALEQYMLGKTCWFFGWDCSPYYAYATLPKPPGRIYCSITGECEPLFAQSYINAYNTAFNQPANPQEALYKYGLFLSSEVNSNFIPGTFGFREYTLGEEAIGASITQSNIIIRIHHLQDELDLYYGRPYLFVSAGSGAGSGFMYLDWIIVTYGVPYVMSVS